MTQRAVEVFDWEDAERYRAGLRHDVAQLRTRYPGVSLGVAQGDAWSTPKRLLDEIRGSETRRLADFVWFALGGRPGERLDGWASWLGAGARILEHDHAQARRSAVFYVDAPVGIGVLALPGLGVQITPRPGRLVLFDGHARHYVPATAVGGRLSLAFNLYPAAAADQERAA